MPHRRRLPSQFAATPVPIDFCPGSEWHAGTRFEHQSCRLTNIDEHWTKIVSVCMINLACAINKRANNKYTGCCCFPLGGQEEVPWEFPLEFPSEFPWTFPLCISLEFLWEPLWEFQLEFLWKCLHRNYYINSNGKCYGNSNVMFHIEHLPPSPRVMFSWNVLYMIHGCEWPGQHYRQ